MHWIAFAILVYGTTVLQTTVAPFIAVHTIRPDWMVIVAVHYALAARSQDAMLACWIIGLVTDLSSLSFDGRANVGISALSLGLTAVLIVAVRDLTFRDSVVTQLVFTFVAKWMTSLLVGLHMLYALDAWDRLGDVLAVSFYAAVYTAILAPYGHALLRRFRNVLGIGVTHRLQAR